MTEKYFEHPTVPPHQIDLATGKALDIGHQLPVATMRDGWSGTVAGLFLATTVIFFPVPGSGIPVVRPESSTGVKGPEEVPIDPDKRKARIPTQRDHARFNPLYDSKGNLVRRMGGANA